MKSTSLRITFVGSLIGPEGVNGHGTVYRALVKELKKTGHNVLFIEQDCRSVLKDTDSSMPLGCKTATYRNTQELFTTFSEQVKNSDLFILGSGVQSGAEIAEWAIGICKGIKAFYDLDPPQTINHISTVKDFFREDLIPAFDIIFTGCAGPASEKYRSLGANAVKILYPSVDVTQYYTERHKIYWDMGFLGNHFQDRLELLQSLMFKPASKLHWAKFIAAGASFPEDIHWLRNIDYVRFIPYLNHRTFYNSLRFALHISREENFKNGFCPGVRMFEAAACGIPIITDKWEGLDQFFDTDKEILIAEKSEDVLKFLKELPDRDRMTIGANARERVLANHSSSVRVQEMMNFIKELNPVFV